jgi:LmbE family N-acetylglucosaminyl deacetylase
VTEPLRLMCVLAHPDDESLGTGGILAQYAAEGVDTYLITATKGERGWFEDEESYPGPEALGRIREAELKAAADVLGIHEIAFLGYQDGELGQVDPAEAIAKIVAHLRRARPHVVVTFDPTGVYGHPDHIAICQLTTAAVAAASDPFYAGEGAQPAYQVAKLYYFVDTEESLELYQDAFGELVTRIDGQERRATAWESWAITTHLDTSAHWQRVWDAVRCHQTQLPGYQTLADLSDERKRQLWGAPTFYRVLSLVNDRLETERDLFEGLR